MLCFSDSELCDNLSRSLFVHECLYANIHFIRLDLIFILLFGFF